MKIRHFTPVFRTIELAYVELLRLISVDHQCDKRRLNPQGAKTVDEDVPFRPFQNGPVFITF